MTHVVGKPAPSNQHLKQLGQYTSSPELSMGWVTIQVGLGNWDGLDCVGSIFGGLGWVLSPKRQKPKIKILLFTEFIDIDGHGVSRQISDRSRLSKGEVESIELFAGVACWHCVTLVKLNCC